MHNITNIMNPFAICIAIISMIVIIFLTREHREYQIHREFINGYWDASQAFCTRSDIKSAQVYFKNDRAYLLIDEGDSVILNKCVDTDISLGLSSSDSSNWTVSFSEDVDPIPQIVEMRLDISRGMMGMFVDDILYLELFKDNKASVGVI